MLCQKLEPPATIKTTLVVMQGCGLFLAAKPMRFAKMNAGIYLCTYLCSYVSEITLYELMSRLKKDFLYSFSNNKYFAVKLPFLSFKFYIDLDFS